MYTKQFFEFVEPYDRMKSAVNAVLPRLVFFLPDCWALIFNFTPGTGKKFSAYCWNWFFFFDNTTSKKGAKFLAPFNLFGCNLSIISENYPNDFNNKLKSDVIRAAVTNLFINLIEL